MVISSECSSKPLLYDQTNDDDDALSLCDLPIYSGNSSNSFSSSNQYEYQEKATTDFDFFSGELDAGNSHIFQGNEAIVFCGNFIGPKDVVDQNQKVKPKKKSVLFSWKSFKIASFRKPSSKKKAIDHKNKFLCSTGFDSLDKLPSVKKVSSLMTCPTKSRWYVFMFGQTRFPQAMTMNLSDLKNRQQRLCSLSPSMKPRVITEGGVSGSGRGRGIWSLLNESVTSVGKTNANDVVRAVGRMSLV